MLPILLTNRQDNIKVLIVGGGKVALRRAKLLIDSGINKIDLISPEFDIGFDTLKTTLLCQKTNYFQQDLSQYTLILACTNITEVNDMVEQDAKESRVLFNRADNRELSDFYIPSTIRRGDIIISISSGVPSFSKKIKNNIEEILPGGIDETCKKLNKIRTLLKKSKIETNKSKAVLDYFSDHHEILHEIDIASPTALSNIFNHLNTLPQSDE